ncbi:hypothetical protein BC939DRAFT_73965 [Gamsiella multidivaricata]|uniref:uncharacterized protein n=1 Tax=Gamsiella multidivaricata TaxID=101098 RepID=UPI00221EAE51|nr:uncharacterized protein BC939DRAFT_73965 [Gamsiella multidivaricata]KAG0355690.1 hypothetical protein BGZ54_001053 [Gamsiella multidivaricata]KAI7815932.1 hypothetical protein BC939DRAFT_73965 [Gamsiella multidivaricata]
MFMTPITLPTCQPRQQADNTTPIMESEDSTAQTLTKKRSTVHITEDSASSKRISLLPTNSHSRSLSESWAFLSKEESSTTPKVSSNDDDDEVHSSDTSVSSTFFRSGSHGSSAATTPSSPSPIPPLHSPEDATVKTTAGRTLEQKDLPDQEFMNSLMAFLKGQNNEDGFSHASSSGPLSEVPEAARMDDNQDNQELRELVVAVRDFAYTKSHPYHFGNYPPEPEYEESEVHDGDDEEAEDEYEDQDEAEERSDGDRTQGHARGLYDFDAENSSELSFKEGDYLWIHCRQFPGWFLGEIEGVQGLVPENYVQLT